MAEQNAAPKEAAAAAPSGGSNKTQMFLMVLVIVNMVAVGAVGFLLWKNKQKEAAEPTIDHVIKGEHDTQLKESKEANLARKPVVPLETFIVNLAGSRGRRVAKVNIEFEVSVPLVQAELDQRKAQVRDIVIILLSGKTYEQIEKPEGRNQLRDEIKDTVNAFLTQGKIENVFFTDFIYN